MARIEELPDDFDESIDLNKPPPPSIPTDSTSASLAAAASNETPFGIKKDRLKQDDPNAPAMPPGMASVKSHTMEELLAEMNKTPLFMTDISQADIDGENVALEAIRALQYEGTRGEIARGFRETGNELAREKKWSDAREFYNKAIATLTTKDDKWEKPEDPEKEMKMQREIEEACYVNRALCNLELKNYRSTTIDCAAALKVNPKNVKAYYRSASALFALDKVAEAEDACAMGLGLDPANKALQALSAKISSRKAALEQLATKKKAEDERAQKEKHLLATALRARAIKVRETAQPPDLEDAAMALTPDPLSPESTLVFPCVLLYPTDAQSDFIKAFGELESIADHLSYIFPLPWDKDGQYTLDSVDCYLETVTGGLIKAGKKMPLLKILSGGKVEVVDGLVKINVVPTSKAAGWIAEMKARRGPK